MKHILFTIALILGVVFMDSCSPKPDNIIHNNKTEDAGWVVKQPGEKPVMKQDTFYQISPTWGQANYYAFKRKDQWMYTTGGLILILGFIILIYGKVGMTKWFPQSLDENTFRFNAILFVLLVGGISLLTANQSGIKWNNDKWVNKEVYDKAIKESGSTQPIWDSLETNHLIIDGPY